MNASVKINGFKRFMSTLRIAFAFLRGRLNEKLQNIGHLFFHLTLFSGRAGYVEFGLEDDWADGMIRYRVTDDMRKVHLLTINFRISNRWLVRRGQKPSPRLLCEIKNNAEIMESLSVHSVVWGQTWNNKLVAPFDLSRLPSEEAIAAHHARMKKVQDFLGKYFPSRGPQLSVSLCDVIKRY